MMLATALNIYCERKDEPDLPLVDSLSMCAKAGYKAVDFGFVELNRQSDVLATDNWKASILKFRQLADNLGINIVQAHGTLYEFCEEAENAIHLEEMMRRSIEGAALLGAKWIVIHPSVGKNKTESQNFEANVQFFRQIADFAKLHHIGIAIENMWGHTPNGQKRNCIKVEDLIELIDAIDHPNVGACWDVEHGSIEKMDNAHAIKSLGKRLKALHISDESGFEHVHILPYMGAIQWNPILEAIAQINYDGPFTFEIQHYLPNMPLQLIPSAMKLSVEVGEYMINQVEAHRAVKAME